MITSRLYRSGALAEQGFDPALVSDYLEERDTLVWLDLEDPTDADLTMIEREFSIHPLAIEDARHGGQRPKVEVYERFFFVVAHAIRLEQEEIVSQECTRSSGRAIW